MKNIISIEGRRDGYAPSQCSTTFTVKELIEYLQYNYSDDLKIYLNNDNGYTYGSINENSFKYERIDDEDESDDE